MRQKILWDFFMGLVRNNNLIETLYRFLKNFQQFGNI